MEGIKKWNQVFDDPVLASKCMDSDFDDSLVAREALASPVCQIATFVPLKLKHKILGFVPSV